MKAAFVLMPLAVLAGCAQPVVDPKPIPQPDLLAISQAERDEVATIGKQADTGIGRRHPFTTYLHEWEAQWDRLPLIQDRDKSLENMTISRKAVLYFERSSSDLDEADLRILDLVSAKTERIQRVSIVGHQSSDEELPTLAHDRASSVRDFLMSSDIPSERLNISPSRFPSASPDSDQSPDLRKLTRQRHVTLVVEISR